MTSDFGGRAIHFSAAIPTVHIQQIHITRCCYRYVASLEFRGSIPHVQMNITYIMEVRGDGGWRALNVMHKMNDV